MADAPVLSTERPVISVSPTLQSNVNWTQVVSFFVGLAAIVGVAIPEEYSKLTIEILVLATPLVTLLFRNFWKGRTPTVEEVKMLADNKGLVVVPPKEVKTATAVAKAKPKK